MKSHVISFGKDERNLPLILEETARTAAYHGLNAKESLHLRLLAEEVCCMIDVLVQSFDGRFWLEGEERDLSLCVSLNTDSMNLELKQELIRTSTDGRNAAARSLSGKIRHVVEDLAMMNRGKTHNLYEEGTAPEALSYSSAWLFSSYRDELQNGPEPVIWDELERSILARLADEITVGVSGRDVTVTVHRRFIPATEEV